MAVLVKLFFLLLCLLGLLFDYHEARIRSFVPPSPSPSPSPSPPSSGDDNDDNQLLCIHSEKTALLQFKSLFGENPPALITWRDEASSDCCYWDGVMCDKLTGHVTDLSLDDRQLHGVLPSNSTLFHLSHLQYLSLSGNDFNGSSISSGLNFPHLTSLDLSSSNFAGSINWLTNLTKLEWLDLSSNKLTGLMATNISSLQKLAGLNLKNNSLSGALLSDLFDFPILEYVDLSFNQFSGAIQLSNNNLIFLDLSHNSFQGPLPQLPPSPMIYFAISHNKLEGDIPLSYCDLRRLKYLILSHNNLSGVIPECITNSSSQLRVLDLGINGFHGTIPDNFPKENIFWSINLKGNRLEGKLPASLANCRRLTVLDIGTNKIKDTFPYWLQSLPELQVLVLRHNKFHGSLGLNARTKRTVNPFPKLRIFDLSHNEFVGPLPSNYFHTLSAMRNMSKLPMGSSLYMGSSQYDDTVEITLKGVDYELPRILNIFAAIDLSDNNFEGKIPNDIGSLHGIQSLNLSHNALAGTIPSTLANLTLLESLDLSSNNLSGLIPQELTCLYFLTTLNLSSNLLTGQIPRGFQFNLFDNDSYDGNLGLCGPPLSKNCSGKNGILSPEEDGDEDFLHGFTWKTVLLGYGCGTALGLGVGFVIFKTGRPKRLVTFVEDELHYMTTKRPRRRPSIVFLSEAQRRRRLGNSLS